ncbi:MAG TPA: sugar ABC transporter permease [Anaerolineaceae bacterium]|nr:sugar ABC transporter permease [Anaerolineaceae bacterium]
MASISPAIDEKRPGFFRQLKRRYPNIGLAYLYILPAFLIMAFITFYPLIYQLWMSVTDFTLRNLRLMNPSFVGLTNYINVILRGLPVPNYNFLRIFVFNIFWTVVNVALHVLIGVAVALILNIEKMPAKRLYRSLFVIPWALPSLVSGMLWANMWHEKYGAVNLLLQQLGFSGNIRWLVETHPIVNLPQIGLVLPLSFVAALIANVWLGWPFMMVIATGALQSIPKEIYEAAEMDGVSGWSKIWSITMPLIRPAMIPAIMIGIMMTFNQFNVIYFITGGGPLGMTEILVTQGFKLVNPQGWFGVASAFNIIVFIILGFITVMTNRVTRATEPYYA